MNHLRHILALGMAILLVGLAAPAMAQDSSIDDGYGGPSEPATSAGASGSGGRLPFSGLDLGLIAAGGVLFVAAGIGLRRAVRSS